MKIFLPLIVALALASCSDVTTGATQGLTLPESQRQRGQVVQAFLKDPAAASATYRPVWQEARNAHSVSVEGITIAGELMAADPGGYQAYYDYVMAAAGANDEWVSSAVMSALSHAKGRDSIDVLLSHATDNRGLVADAAMTALNFRMTTAEFDPSMSGDFEYMKSKLPGLCRNHYAASIKQYCNP